MDNIIDYKFKSITSFSHMLGCVTALLVDYIRSAFNDQYFKTIRTTTEVPYVERSKWYRDILQKPRPMMIIDPKFDPSDEAKFLPTSEFDIEIPNEPTGPIWFGMNSGTPLIMDPTNKYQLMYKGARYKMSFNITFIFDSEVQRMQSQEFIRKNIRHKIPIVIQRFIENNIPQHFMDAIAYMNNMDINSDEFISYVNKISGQPISHRVRTGSGNKEFFCMSPTELSILFTSNPTNNGPVRKGNIVVSSSFTEDIEVDFPAQSMYFLRTDTNIADEIDMSGTNILMQSSMKAVAIQRLLIAELPIFNDYENDYKKVLQITVQSDSNDENVVNIDSYVNGEVRQVIEYYREQKMPITFLRAAVAEGANRLDGARIAFNADTLDVTISDIDMYKVYHIALYVDYKFINDLKKSIFAFDNYEDIK